MSRIQVVSILVMAGLFVLVFELVRQRRLMERYALLWLFSAATLLTLAVWRDLLDLFASAIGIFYAPSALFAVALGFVLALLLHYSVVISRLTDQTKVLAQKLARLEHDVGAVRATQGLDRLGEKLAEVGTGPPAATGAEAPRRTDPRS